MIRGTRWLAVFGGATTLVYLAILHLSIDFPYGRGFRERPLLEVLMLFGAAFAIYLLSLWLITRPSGSLVQGREVVSAEVRQFRTIMLFAVLFRLILLFSNPIQEIDYYRYLWDGRVLAEGVNPFRYSPSDVDREGPTASPESELGRLWRLANSTDTVRAIFDRVHHREVPTIYPPLAQVVFAAAALTTKADDPLWVHTLNWKGILFLFDMATLLVLIRLLTFLRMPRSFCIAYAWCPLVMKELSNSGHLDAIAVFFTTLSVYLFATLSRLERAGRTRKALWRAVLGAGVLGAGVLAKSYPVVLVPVLGAYLLPRGLKGLVSAALVFLLVVVVGYFPFIGGSGEGPGHSPFSGLGTFLGRWEMNDFLFMIVHENLRPARDVGDLWFVVLPSVWREAIGGEGTGWLSLFSSSDNAGGPFLLTRTVMGLALLVLVLRRCRVLYRNPDGRELARSCFLILIWGCLLSSAQNPWYLLWALPLMMFEPRKSWWLLPGLSFLYYLRFYLEYQSLGSAEALAAARQRFDFGWVWVEYVPFFTALLLETGFLARGNRLAPPKNAESL